MAKKDELDIDWDDPKAVAAARGDNVDDDAGDPDETPGAEEEAQGDEGKGEPKKAEAGEAGEEGGEEAGDEDKKAEPMIPKSRYDSKAAENRSLKEKLAQYERDKAAKAAESQKQEQAQSLETEIDTLEDQYMEAISKDEMDRAKQLRKEIRAKEREMFKAELETESGKTTDRTREQIRLDMTIDSIEQNHPEFNPDSDSYDEELVTKVQELRMGFEATGKYSQTQALLKAMDYVMPKRDASKDVPSDKQVDNEAEERRKAGLKKATEAANRQPPKTEKVGEEADALGKDGDLNVDKLSYDDIAKLPESTLRRLRGDYAA